MAPPIWPTREETTLEDRIRQMLRDLGRALSEAMADSSEVDEVLRRVRAEGYKLIIVLDRSGGDDRETKGSRPVVPEDERPAPPFAAKRRAWLDEGSPPPPHATGPDSEGGVPPAFKIDGADLAFLRSIGIDPTRKIRGRKRDRTERWS